jgi:hypothetical protein
VQELPAAIFSVVSINFHHRGSILHRSYSAAQFLVSICEAHRSVFVAAAGLAFQFVFRVHYQFQSFSLGSCVWMVAGEARFYS